MTGTKADVPELHLCVELEDESTRVRRREAGMVSFLLHLAMVFALVVQARVFPPDKTGASEKAGPHVTLLFPAPRELTQKQPNLSPPSKLFLGEPELPRPPLLVMPGAPPSAPPPPPSKGDLANLERPPQMVPKPDPSGTLQLAQIIPPPALPEPPKLALESVQGPPAGRQGDLQAGLLTPQRPGNVIEGSIRDLSRNPGLGGTVVGDGLGGGVPGGFTLPSPGNVGSNLELLSDPMGVDFKPYLIRILATVRRNWYAVIPESARLGIVRGRVAIQFIIIRAGGVSKLVIASPSGVEALDRAAVAGISASHPFPPLPSEFRGDQVRLQFTFLYNIPIR